MLLMSALVGIHGWAICFLHQDNYNVIPFVHFLAFAGLTIFILQHAIFTF